MATLPEVIKHSELLNRLVLQRSTMEELGRIEVLWMYPPMHRVLGFVCKAGFWGNTKLAFKLSQVEAIGDNGVLTHSRPDETDADRVRQLETLIQCEVWSNAGSKLGKIVDCVFSLRTGLISNYLVVGDRLSSLAGTMYRLPPDRIMSLGRRRVLVAETALEDLPLYREGLTQKIAHMGHEVKEEYSQVTEELRSLAKRAQTTTRQTTAQLKTLAEQAKDRAQTLAEQALDKADELNEQLRENAHTVTHRARGTGSVWLQDWQERAANLREDLQDGTESFTIQAQEILDSVVADALEPPGAKPPAPPSDLEDDFFDALFADVEAAPTPPSPGPTPASPRSPNPPPETVTTVEATTTEATTAEATIAPPDDDPWNLDEDWNLNEALGPTAPLPPCQTIPVEAWDVEEETDPWEATPPAPPATSPERSPQIPPTETPSASPNPQPELEDEPWI